MLGHIPSCIILGKNMLLLVGIKGFYEEVLKKLSWKCKQRSGNWAFPAIWHIGCTLSCSLEWNLEDFKLEVNMLGFYFLNKRLIWLLWIRDLKEKASTNDTNWINYAIVHVIDLKDPPENSHGERGGNGCKTYWEWRHGREDKLIKLEMMEKKRNPGSHQLSVLSDLDGGAIRQVRRLSRTSKMEEIIVTWVICRLSW